MSSSFSELKFSLSSLKEKVKKLTKMCESTDFKQNEAYEILSQGLIDIIDIKHYNSKIQSELEIVKEECDKEQEKAEEKNLNYQNYVYQKENIVNQINQCESFNTPQINKIFGSYNSNITVDKLNNELLGRKKLQEKYNEISHQREDNLIELNKKEEYIKSIPIHLNSINTTTLQAQDLLNVNLYQKYPKSKNINLLPQPLYVIYYSLLMNVDYKDVKINGNESEVENFYREYPNERQFKLNDNNSKEEGEQSDDGEFQIKNINNINDINTINLTSKIKCFPLNIQYKVNFDLKINFKYYPILNIVTCEIGPDSNKFKTNELMSNLFDYKGNYKIKNKKDKAQDEVQIKSIIESQCEKFNKGEEFYEYIQILSNNSGYNIQNVIRGNSDLIINYDNYTQSENVKNIDNITMSNFISEIRQRVINIPILKNQINYIKVNKKLIQSHKVFKSEIKNFDEDTQENYYKNNTNGNNIYKNYAIFEYDAFGNLYKSVKQEKIKKYSKNEAFYYKLEVKNSDFTLVAFIEIGFDYPKTSPTFIVKINTIEDKNVFTIPESMKDLINKNNNPLTSNNFVLNQFSGIESEIQNEINEGIKCDYCNDGLMLNLFNRQIEKLMELFDILIRIKNSDKVKYCNLFKGKNKLIDF